MYRRIYLIPLLALTLLSCGVTEGTAASPAEAADASVQAQALQLQQQNAQLQALAIQAAGLQQAAAQAQPPASTPVPAVQTPAPAYTPQPIPQAQVPVTQAVSGTGVVPVASPVLRPGPNLRHIGDRADRRQLKAERYAAYIDSLIASRNFVFLPNSLQELPGGTIRYIYNQFYYLGLFSDHVEVHLPAVRGGQVLYYEILNFDTFDLKNYRASRTQSGWIVTFNVTSGSSGDPTVYAVNLAVCSATGEATLDLLTLHNTVHYVGYLEGVAGK